MPDATSQFHLKLIPARTMTMDTDNQANQLLQHKRSRLRRDTILAV